MDAKINKSVLDGIIDEMVQVVENSKDEIFHISEEARNEHESITKKLQEIKADVLEHIEEGDRLEIEVQKSRKKLVKVSKDFDKHSEHEIKQVYEDTHEMQTRLAMKRQKEKLLRERRDDLERRLLSLSETIERAEGLVGKVSVISTYLQEDFQHVNDLLETAKEKQEFGLKIIEAQEEERRKISREIHDGPAQMLANILLRSEIIDRTIKDGHVEEGLKEIRSVRGMIRSSLYEVRRIIYDLRPMALDDLGLVPTLQKYIHTIADYHQIEIDFKLLGEDRRLPQKYEIAFFRLMQEALQNAIRHGGSTHIQVRLEIHREVTSMVIKDNGAGFDVNQKKEKSFGLIGMRERVEMLDGTLEITSELDFGTSVVIKVPNSND